MKKFLMLAGMLILSIYGCEQGVSISVPDKLSGLEKVTFKYEYLNTTPEYHQSLMMTGMESELYIYGAYGSFFVYDLNANDWNKTYFSRKDTVSWRWDGAIGYLNSKVYVIATPSNSINYDSFPKYYNILEVDPNTGSLKTLPELLPFRRWSYYPAYGTYNGKIAVVFQNMDSVYVFDSTSKKGKFVAQNILKMPDNNNSYPSYSYGINDEYLYVYKRLTKEFYRFSLQTYKWDKIEIESQILSIMPQYARGGMFKGLFCLWGPELNVALVFNSFTGRWILANKDIPNDNFLVGENSFFATSEALYVVHVFSRNLWKIKLVSN